MKPRVEPHIVADQSAVIDFLSQRETHGGRRPVRIETHAAVVFLAGPYAYKMKRAVRFPFLDFSTLAKRGAVCRAELKLNRPFAPELYLDTVPVVRRGGMLALGGPGRTVEWLVRMKRFDPGDTLDHVADRGGLSDALVAGLVGAIARQHDAAKILRRGGATERLRDWMRGNFDELREAPQVIPAARVEALREESEAAFQRHEALLRGRETSGFVRRCHGDLHLRNVVLLRGRPVLFDALEFDDLFATHDIFYDLAFLLMDLWQRGRHAEANRVLNLYLWRDETAENIDGVALLPLFMSIRAAIRAKVAVSTAAMESGRAARAALADARRYFAFAERYLVSAKPALVAVGGLSGTGKTRVSQAIAPAIGRPPGALHLRSDIERKRLFKVADTKRLPAKTYTQTASDAVYERLRDKAARGLDAGSAVVVDAVHGRPDEREAVEEIVRRRKLRFTGLWLQAPDKLRKTRVGKRKGDASDADAAVADLQSGFDTGPIAWQRIDASRDLADVIARSAAALRGRAPRRR
jgi:aminoglycoside phosphotransferase family enzyme/predicted kinase